MMRGAIVEVAMLDKGDCMPPKADVVHALIRRVMDGRGAATAKRKLIAAGAGAVRPTLEALAGHHGRVHPDNAGQATSDLMKVLAEIAKRNVTPLAEALTHDTPSLNAVVWAIGHSRSRHARQLLESLAEHEDGGVRAVVRYHTRKKARRRPRRAAKKKAPAKKKAGARKR